METTNPPAFDELMNQAKAIRQEATTFLEQNGRRVDLGEWVTIAEYTKRFGLNSTMVVTNWIKRGIVPEDNIITVPELNNIWLIKAVPYHDE